MSWLHFRRCVVYEYMNLVGSETLHKWRTLATPHLASVLEPRPGVQIKGQNMDSCVEEEEYSISDIEEDGEFACSLTPLLLMSSGYVGRRSSTAGEQVSRRTCSW